MWTRLADGDIDYISSDHAPATQAQKRSGSIWEAHFGLPGLDTTMPLLLTAAAAGRLSYERLVDVYATMPSRLYGLAAKGRLEQGCDADIILVDPTYQWELAPEHLFSKAGWSPYLGRKMIGRTIETYVRGQLVAARGAVVPELSVGQFVPGPGARIAASSPPNHGWRRVRQRRPGVDDLDRGPREVHTQDRRSTLPEEDSPRQSRRHR